MNCKHFSQHNNNGWLIAFDYSLLQHLADSTTDKRHGISRWQAFCYIIERQRLYMLTHDSRYVTTTISTLSDEWGWDRSATKKFLDLLIEHHAIHVTPQGRKRIIFCRALSANQQQLSTAGNKLLHPEPAIDTGLHTMMAEGQASQPSLFDGVNTLKPP